jgi:hypothetical protein
MAMRKNDPSRSPDVATAAATDANTTAAKISERSPRRLRTQ